MTERECDIEKTRAELAKDFRNLITEEIVCYLDEMKKIFDFCRDKHGHITPNIVDEMSYMGQDFWRYISNMKGYYEGTVRPEGNLYRSKLEFRKNIIESYEKCHSNPKIK